MSITEKQQQLRRNYIASLDEKILHLQQCYELSGDHVDEVLYSALHKLSGSAGMYGFEDISKQAHSLLRKIDNREDKSTELTSGVPIADAEAFRKLFADLLVMMKNAQ